MTNSGGSSESNRPPARERQRSRARQPARLIVTGALLVILLLVGLVWLLMRMTVNQQRLVGALLLLTGSAILGLIALFLFWREPAPEATRPPPAVGPPTERDTIQLSGRGTFLVDQAGRRHVLGDDVVIGRDPATDLVIDSSFGKAYATVSSRHARLFRDARSGTYFIEDLDSLNGVFIGGAPTRLNPLKDGDIIGLGSLRLKVLEGNAK